MDRVKPLLDKLGIEPNDNWITEHILGKGKKDICYYYTFIHEGVTYCVSADSFSCCFSSDIDFKIIYMGYSMKTLEKKILKELKK